MRKAAITFLVVDFIGVIAGASAASAQQEIDSQANKEFLK